MKKTKTPQDARSIYSAELSGDVWNWNRVTGFDLTAGYLGITQKEGGTVCDRVLLTPGQVKAMLAFITETQG